MRCSFGNDVFSTARCEEQLSVRPPPRPAARPLQTDQSHDSFQVDLNPSPMTGPTLSSQPKSAAAPRLKRLHEFTAISAAELAL